MSDTPINVLVKTEYLAEQSNPAESRYIYTYTITIENTGKAPAQLISRRWVIYDTRNQKREVEGLGVVGEQPRIAPGESFTYTSGVILETPTGTMGGSYQMEDSDGEAFDVTIPTFALVPPYAIH